MRSRFGAILAWTAASFILSLFPLTTAFAAGDNPTIFDVRRSLPLEPDEPVAHDFYINAGSEAGLKKGSFITVVREIPVHDPIQNKQQGTLNARIARLQIIHVERNLTVARLDEEFTDDDRPAVDFESVMIGDRVDLSSVTSENTPKKKKVKKHVADVKSDDSQGEGVSAAKAAELAVLPPAPALPSGAPPATMASGSSATTAAAPVVSAIPAGPPMTLPPKTAPAATVEATRGAASTSVPANAGVVSAPVPAPAAAPKAPAAPVTGASNEEKLLGPKTTSPAAKDPGTGTT